MKLLKYAVSVGLLLWGGMASALEHKVDEAVMDEIATALGVPGQALVILTMSDTGNVTTHIDSSDLTSDSVSLGSAGLTNFGLVYTDDYSYLTAKINGVTLGQTLPVGSSSEESTTVSASWLEDVDPALIVEIKTLLEVDQDNALLVFAFASDGMSVLKSSDEFSSSAGTGTIDEVITGSIASDADEATTSSASLKSATASTSSSDTTTTDDGCTVYYITIDGQSYSYLICD